MGLFPLAQAPNSRRIGRQQANWDDGHHSKSTICKDLKHNNHHDASGEHHEPHKCSHNKANLHNINPANTIISIKLTDNMRRLGERSRRGNWSLGLLVTLVTLASGWPQIQTTVGAGATEGLQGSSIISPTDQKTETNTTIRPSTILTTTPISAPAIDLKNDTQVAGDNQQVASSNGIMVDKGDTGNGRVNNALETALVPKVSHPFDPMVTAASKKKKKSMKKSKKMEKKHKEWKKGKKHKKKKYESKKKKGGSSKKKKGKKEKKKWGMEKKGHKKKGNFKKKKWGHKKKMKKGHKKGKKGHKMLKDKGHKKKGFKKVYHKEEWGKKKKWHDIKREKKWNTKQKKWKKKWHQEKGKKYKGKHMKKYHKKNKHGKKYKKEKKSKWKKHKGEKFKKGHKKKKEEYSKKKEGGKKKKMKKSKKEMKKKKKG